MYDIPHSVGKQLSMLKSRGFKFDILIYFLNRFINVNLCQSNISSKSEARHALLSHEYIEIIYCFIFRLVNSQIFYW